MSRNYQLKYVEDEVWEKTPEDIQNKKKRFGTLQHFIKIRKKRIERLKNKLRELKEERREWEKERTQLYKELHSFQTNYIPSVSPTQQSSNNYQWSLNVDLGNIKRKVYLGSDKNVRYKVDEILQIAKYGPRVNDWKDNLSDECREDIRRIITNNLMKEMEKDNDMIIKKWRNNNLKFWDFLK